MEERKTKELTTEEVNVYIKDCGDIKVHCILQIFPQDGRVANQ